MGTREEKLERDIGELYEQLNEIRDRRRLTESTLILGKCFKYHNCYSCPESDADRWWLYVRVLSVDEDGYPHGVKFQIDKYGKAEIDTNPSLSIAKNNGYIEIPQTEWEAARRDFMAYVTKLAALDVGSV